MLLLLTISQALATEPCFNLIDSYAASHCLSVPNSYEVDMGDGPVVTFSCDLGNDWDQDEQFALFSLAPDISPFFEEGSLSCDGGDLWIDGGSLDELDSGISVSWLSWMMFHEWDDDRAEGSMTHLDDWMIEQTVLNLHHSL